MTRQTKEDLHSLSTDELKRGVDLFAAQFEEGMTRIDALVGEINRRRKQSGQALLHRSEVIRLAMSAAR